MVLIRLFGDEVIAKIKVNIRKEKSNEYLVDVKENLIVRNK